jgi:hypothetical protein
VATQDQHTASAGECAPEGQEVELLELPPGAMPPGGISLGDLFKYLPVVQQIIQAFAAGTGSFITKTPFGRFQVDIKRVA